MSSGSSKNAPVAAAHHAAAAGTPYSVAIKMSGDTVKKLQDNSYQLFAFKGIDGPPKAVPVVWFTTDRYSTTTDISWQEQYAGYASLSTTVAPGTEIVASDTEPMNLGQIMHVGAGGVGIVGNEGGSQGEIAIINDTTTEFVCGVSQLNTLTNQTSPICAFTLFGDGLDMFVPIELVYFMFATNAVNTGTVIEQSFARGIQVNMTGGVQNAPLTFDIDKGWSGPGYTTNYDAKQDLLPLLINPGGAALVSARAALRRRNQIAALKAA
jgi:hypothetical protein